MADSRKIIHVDMDAFFASVEQRDFPHLRGKPVIVGGQPDSRGVVAAASYEARHFGIHSAMPSATAYRLCAHAIFVRPRFETYRQVSHAIQEIFHQYTDLVEPLSLDEAYLDVTQNKKQIPSATWVAQAIRREIYAKTGLTASAGVAFNKFLAKMASSINKPNGQFVIHPHEALGFVAQLPIGKFYGIGKATEKKMHRLGIFNGSDLKRFGEEELNKHFGKSGQFYFDIANGRDNRAVSPHRLRKSVGVEETFHTDLTSFSDMHRELEILANTLQGRLDKVKLAGKTITLKFRYANFETLTRSQTQQQFISNSKHLATISQELLQEHCEEGKGVRLLGISVSNLNNQEAPPPLLQLSLPFDSDTWF